MYNYLEFEKSIADVDGKILELKKMSEEGNSLNMSEEIERLEQKSAQAMHDLYSNLTAWQKTQVARHPDRPHFLHYAERLFTDFTPLAGDRKFAEDSALQAGFARFRGQAVAFLGLEKGHDTESRMYYNFGSARPEGYRKAVRIMQLAQRFKLPIISLVDTAGAYPGVSAEERGQAEAIARSTEMMLSLNVPVVAVIIGEGGSGGAIAIAAANKVYMLEHSIYSVISPEGAASILWRDAAKAKDAADNMKITAQDLLNLKVIDGIIPEPIGGAHRAAMHVIDSAGDIIAKALEDLNLMSGDALKRQRWEKFLAIGRNL
ncbi:acetyl-CoA carboxylase carboxyltransferase subunit alpha [Bartonella sp. DGB1]|uniref:acetyl-CoA carboxylase carboxyltransferase subunit alpha n=1 Tax=Bartonella sp. DGB1 TaxID=3239807 RepID=UPI003524591F